MLENIVHCYIIEGNVVVRYVLGSTTLNRQFERNLQERYRHISE